MIEDAIIALSCWIFGFIALVKTDWVAQHALALQQRYPKALTMRMAERSWYPKVLRVGGIVLLILAGILTFEVATLVSTGWTLR